MSIYSSKEVEYLHYLVDEENLAWKKVIDKMERQFNKPYKINKDWKVFEYTSDNLKAVYDL